MLEPDGRWCDGTDSACEGRIEIIGFEGLVLDLDDLWREVDSIIEPGEGEIVEEEP